MYKNLEAEMVRKGINRKDISELLDVRYATIVEKLNGKYPFKLDEALAIKKKWFPEFSIEYLFDKNEEAAKKMLVRKGDEANDNT